MCSATIEKEKRIGTVLCIGLGALIAVAACMAPAQAEEAVMKANRYASPVVTESFESIMAKMKAAKPEIIKQHTALLEQRYDLSDTPLKGVAMSRGKDGSHRFHACALAL